MADRQTCLHAVTAATAGLETEGRKQGTEGGGGGVCRAAATRGEGVPCLHFVWNEEQDEGCVKDTEGVCFYLYRCVFVLLYIYTVAQ